MMYSKSFFLIVATSLFLVALRVDAWSLFGSNAQSMLGRADRTMARADDAFGDENFELACRLYLQAIKGFEGVEKTEPGYMNGLPAIRIAYCSAQYTNSFSTLKDSAELQSVEGSVTSEPPVSDPVADAAAAFISATGDGDVARSQQVSDSAGDTATEAVGKSAKDDYDPRNFTYDFNEAKSLIEDGDLGEAAAILTTLAKHDPKNRSVRLLIGIVRTKQRRYEEALTALEDLRGRREDLPLLLAISGAYIGSGRYHDALLALDSAVKLTPEDPAAYMNLAWLSLSMPDGGPDAAKNAEIYYRQAIRRGATRDVTLEKMIGLK